MSEKNTNQLFPLPSQNLGVEFKQIWEKEGFFIQSIHRVGNIYLFYLVPERLLLTILLWDKSLIWLVSKPCENDAVKTNFKSKLQYCYRLRSHPIMLGTDDWVDICNMLFSYCIGSTHLILFDVKPRYVYVRCSTLFFQFSIFYC